MVQKKLRILLAEAEPSETAETLRTLFPDAVGGLDLTVVSTMATLVPTAKIVDPEIILLDPMTGLYTREGLQTVGSRCMEEARRTGESLVLICALFENLHTLRDGFGPGAADHALRDVATLLAGSCLRSDLVARLGPEQF